MGNCSDLKMLLNLSGSLRAQFVTLPMGTVFYVCFRHVRLPSWCFLNFCRNSDYGLACVWYLDRPDVSDKFLST